MRCATGATARIESRILRPVRSPLALALALALAAGPGAARCPVPELGATPSAVSARLLKGRLAHEPVPVPTRIGHFTILEARAIQDALTCALTERLGPVAGYKVAFASEAVQRRFGMREPAWAPLFEAQRLADGEQVAAAEWLDGRVFAEAELAFSIGRRIARPLDSIGELRPAVRSLHAGLDLPERRYAWEEGGAADAVADGLGAHRFALGPGVPPAGVATASLELSLERDTAALARGPASAVLGDPWNALLWLANDLARRGAALEPGQVVLSGAAAPPYGSAGAQAAGDWVGRAGALPPVHLRVR